MSRHKCPPPPEVGLSAVEHWRIIFAMVITFMVTSVVAYTLFLVAG